MIEYNAGCYEIIITLGITELNLYAITITLTNLQHIF